MNAIRNILCAVRDPAAAEQPGIRKAIAIAKSFGASLELFHALPPDQFLDLSSIAGTMDRDRERDALEHCGLRLEEFAAPARRENVAVSCTVVSDPPPHEAILRRAARSGADLIIAECHQGGRHGAWLMHLTDWELARTSTLPVLLIKGPKPYDNPVVLAAVDPGHKHAKPLDLDGKILAAGTRVCETLRGTLHVMHADNQSLLPAGDAESPVPAYPAAVMYEAQRKRDRETFEKFATDAGVPRERRHVVDEGPAAAIPQLARELGASLVVMGAVSRSALKRLLIGNTAERVLDALPCDVLIVKPDGEKAVHDNPA